MPDRLDTQALPAPTHCDCCASTEVSFKGNEVLYGKPFGKWPYCYYCNDCGAAVGCHPDTKIPLGRMADKLTRKLRAKAHEAFDTIWQSGAMSRSDAYELLARHMGMTREECHISQMTHDELKFVIEQCKDLSHDETVRVLKRRKEKKDAKRNKRREREKRAEKRFGKYTKQTSFAARRPRSGDEDS